MQYDSLDGYKKQLDEQLKDMLKKIADPDKLVEEAEDEKEGEVMEYRYVRRPNGEVVIMSKPFSKLTAKEMRDTENGMTSEPFGEKDPDVKVTKLKEKLPEFKLESGLEKKKSINYMGFIIF